MTLPEEYAFYLVVILPANVCSACKVKLVENIDRLIKRGYSSSIIYLSQSPEDFMDIQLKNLILHQEDLENVVAKYNLNTHPILMLIKNNQIVCDFLAINVSKLYQVDDFILRNQNFLQIRSSK